MRWKHKTDRKHTCLYRMDCGCELHTFLNGCDEPYAAVYSPDGYECGSLPCAEMGTEEAIRQLQAGCRGRKEADVCLCPSNDGYWERPRRERHDGQEASLAGV